jgi:NADPH:quinone reductase-like Zn-dependent oxidoreductase
VTGLASSANHDFVRSLGADQVIDYKDTDFTTAVHDQDVVLDVVGGDYPARSLEVLKPGGMLVSTQPPTLAPVADAAATRQIRLAGLFVEADELGLSELADLAAADKLTPAIAATFPLEEIGAAAALADLAAGQDTTTGATTFPLEEGGAARSGQHGPGKVVLTVT